MSIRLLLMIVSFILSALTGITIAYSNNDITLNNSNKNNIVIGLSLDTLKETRWQRDRDIFVSQAESLGVKVLVQAANGDDTTQVRNVESLISNNVDVLVIVPHNAKAMATSVEKAHAAGIPVISYDRLIQDSEVDLYISFDNIKVGEAQAKFLLEKLNGKGTIIRIYGSKTDNNAFLFKQGQDNILNDYIQRGDIKVIHEDWAQEWKPENGKKITNAAITQHGNSFDAVLAANDGTAGGAIQALIEEGLAGKKIVIGQDAELVACQRIIEGTQTMTIYKPVKKLAEMAAIVAVDMAKRKVIIAKDAIFNGKHQVPTIAFEIQVVTRENMRETIVQDNFHSEEELYGSKE